VHATIKNSYKEIGNIFTTASPPGEREDPKHQ